MKVLKKLSFLVVSLAMSFSAFSQDNSVSDDEILELMGVTSDGIPTLAGVMTFCLEIERFNEIYEASMSPDKEVEATNDELQKQQQAMKSIEAAQSEFQGKVTQLIKNEGFTLEKYQQVFAQLQSDEELQKKFSELMQG